VNVTLNDILYAVAYIEVVVGAAETTMEVPEMEPAPVVAINCDCTEPPSVAAGGSVSLAASVLSGTPIAYQWWWGVDPYAGNDPDPPLSNTSTASVTISPAHWFSDPDSWCPPVGSTYSIYLKATADNTIWSDTASSSLTVSVASPLGATSFPMISGPVTVGCLNGNCTIYNQTNPYVWYAPVESIFALQTSQFYDKAKAHEDVHVAQFGPGGMNSDLWDVNVAWAAVQPLQAPTRDALRALIGTTMNHKHLGNRGGPEAASGRGRRICCIGQHSAILLQRRLFINVLKGDIDETHHVRRGRPVAALALGTGLCRPR
jgi:hypothetical protein